MNPETLTAEEKKEALKKLRRTRFEAPQITRIGSEIEVIMRIQAFRAQRNHKRTVWLVALILFALILILFFGLG